MRVIAIDIGNTKINIGFFNGRMLVVKKTMLMDKPWGSLVAELALVNSKIAKKTSHVEAIILCSVVPKFNRKIIPIFRRKWRQPVLVVGRNIIVPIKNNYEIPSQVGSDRLVVCYAAKQLYGKPAVVIDMGTAMTFDIISRKGDYEGGMIFPGIQMATDSLFSRTALLPKVLLQRPPRALIGRNTKESILCGMFYGYGAVCRGIIELIKERKGNDVKVIVTGGSVVLVRKFLAGRIDKIDNNLVLKGLNLLVNIPQSALST